MNIVVCIKQVPDPEHFASITVDPIKGVIRREGVPAIINPNDRNAVETGLQIREQFGGKLTILTMGPPEANKAIELALAMGADEGIHLCDEAFGGADTLATARTLAAAIRKYCRFDLILCGNETIDSGTSQVGPQLAEFLDIPHVSSVIKADWANEQLLVVERTLDYGYMKVKVSLPALLTIHKKMNQPRLPTAIGIMSIADKETKLYGLNDVGLSPEHVGIDGSPTRMARLITYGQERKCEFLTGDIEDIARAVVTKFKEWR